MKIFWLSLILCTNSAVATPFQRTQILLQILTQNTRPIAAGITECRGLLASAKPDEIFVNQTDDSLGVQIKLSGLARIEAIMAPYVQLHQQERARQISRSGVQRAVAEIRAWLKEISFVINSPWESPLQAMNEQIWQPYGNLNTGFTVTWNGHRSMSLEGPKVARSLGKQILPGQKVDPTKSVAVLIRTDLKIVGSNMDLTIQFMVTAPKQIRDEILAAATFVAVAPSAPPIASDGTL